MKTFTERTKANLGCIFILVFILLIIIGGIYHNNQRKNLFTHGKQTIGYVFKKPTGKFAYASYYIFIKGYLYKNSSSSSNIKFSIVNNFFIVYYDPKNPKNSVMDFAKWVNPDSVETYFPKGQCPFAREIWKAKGLVEE